jgi:hypothetical protein
VDIEVFHADRQIDRQSGRTDGQTTLLVDCRNFAKAPKKVDFGNIFTKYQNMHNWRTTERGQVLKKLQTKARPDENHDQQKERGKCVSRPGMGRTLGKQKSD